MSYDDFDLDPYGGLDNLPEDLEPLWGFDGEINIPEFQYEDDPFLYDAWDIQAEQVLSNAFSEIDELKARLAALENADFDGSLRGPFSSRNTASRYAATIPARTTVIYDEEEDFYYVEVYGTP